MANIAIVILSLLLLGMPSPSSAGEGYLMPEVPPPEVVRAYKHFWESFDAYEKKVLEEGANKYSESWNSLKQNNEKRKKEITEKKIDILGTSSKKYYDHLEAHPDADNAPYVMLNLAQILNMIGNEYDNLELAERGNRYRNESLSILNELERKYPNFRHREETLYLRAIILDGLGQDKSALAVWKKLADTAKSTIYGVYAKVAIGDHYFKKEDSSSAYSYYRSARELINSIKIDNEDYEKLRVDYRLAWSAYRAANLTDSVDAGIQLLLPGRSGKLESHRIKIQQDAIELVGDSLYENNDMEYTRKVLARKDLMKYAPAIGLRAVKNYLTSKLYNDVIELGELISGKYPLSKELPDLLTILSSCYQITNQKEARIKSLEKLSLLLPKQSLWRSRHSDDFKEIRLMEQKAREAAYEIAEYYYQYGIASGNRSSFKTASSYYDMLVEFEPNSESSNKLRLKKANSDYFAGQYGEAITQYSSLKENFKVETSVLKVSAYQIVMAKEKVWRTSYLNVLNKGQDPKKNPLVVQNLRDMEKSINEYVDRFPPKQLDFTDKGDHAVDLLLVGAEANRDHEDYASALKFWQRALVSNPTIPQRSIAIRGILFAKIARNETSEIVGLTRKYLRLENWKDLGPSLANELKGMLSRATFDESDKLNNTGKVIEAGDLLLSVAREFPDIPERDKIYKNGAYLVAIGGDWNSAYKAAVDYLESPSNKDPADMLYLKAKAEEYQLRLPEAARTYLELGEKYPKHSKANKSLVRSEKLAVNEGEYVIAAEAADTLGDHEPKDSEKFNCYERAYKYYQEASQPEKQLTVAKKLSGITKTKAQTLRVKLLIASSMFKSGDEFGALGIYRDVSEKSSKTRGGLNNSDYSEIAGESNFYLGEESFRKFTDYNILERGGSIENNALQKIKYFEELVLNYDKSSKADHPIWSTRSNYRIGEASEFLADEIASLNVKVGKNHSETVRDKWTAKVNQLRKLAEVSYSKNITLKVKEPSVYKNNLWVKKSSIKLSGYLEISQKDKKEDQLPLSSGLNMPNTWSVE
ncbi:MAG: hypothetical protein HQK54_00900 [Oligoflexales bacterium]|nr:hypothetical protein [Oligoflexales bacterium]